MLRQCLRCLLIVIHAKALAEHRNKTVHIAVTGRPHMEAPLVLARRRTCICRQWSRMDSKLCLFVCLPDIVVHVGGHSPRIEVWLRRWPNLYVVNSLKSGVVDMEAGLVNTLENRDRDLLEYDAIQRFSTLLVALLRRLSSYDYRCTWHRIATTALTRFPPGLHEGL